jgi:hypothetical protein
MVRPIWYYHLKRATKLMWNIIRLGGDLRGLRRLSIRALGRALQRVQLARRDANVDARADRAAARAEKRAARACGLDVYGSVARRAASAERDAAEAARPVRSVFSGGAGFLNLRPIEERVARRKGA